MVIDLKEDRLGENLRADERVVYRAPRGRGRLNRRALKIQAFIGLVVFIAISLFDGQWSIETLVIFGGLIGLQIYQYLAYDLAITDQRLIWMSNRWFGDAQSTWLKDIEQVDVVWNPFFPILEVSGDLGKLLSTGNFPDVGDVAERLVGLCQPKRRFVPSRGLMKSIDLLIGFTLFIIILLLFSAPVLAGSDSNGYEGQTRWGWYRSFKILFDEGTAVDIEYDVEVLDGPPVDVIFTTEEGFLDYKEVLKQLSQKQKVILWHIVLHMVLLHLILKAH